jgi:hypothetical protein
MVGGDLPSADAWTLSLLTNPEVIAVDQHSAGNHPLINTDKAAVWLAHSTSDNTQYLAVFNLTNAKADMRYAWKDLGLPGKSYQLRDLWEHKDLGSATALTVELPAHACALYRLTTGK